MWKLHSVPFDSGPVVANQAPIFEFLGKESYCDIDHHRTEPLFLTAGTNVELWEHSRHRPLQTFSWGNDTVLRVRFNPVEKKFFATSAADRSIALYDLRLSTPINRLVMKTRTNAISWNPLEVFNFTTANEDSNLYTYDVRKLKTALNVHKGFVAPVLDVDFCPTGREFVAGSYDCSIRIFANTAGHSREIYHTKPMTHVFTVKFSTEGDYVFSGSDDKNIRMWKADASKRQGPLFPAEKNSQAYNRALISRYQYLPNVNKIRKKSHLPKTILKTAQLKRVLESNERLSHIHVKERSGTCLFQLKTARTKRIVEEQNKIHCRDAQTI